MGALNARGHLDTCTPFCGKLHCRCGRDALHGSRRCGVCAEEARKARQAARNPERTRS